MSQNQYGNNSLARGLGRSTIATSGQAGIQDRGNRISNEVEGQRVTAMGNIESQKVQLQQALQNSLLGLEAQQSSDSLNLARQLEEMAYNRDFQGQQFEFTKEQDAYNRDFKGNLNLQKNRLLQIGISEMLNSSIRKHRIFLHKHLNVRSLDILRKLIKQDKTCTSTI